MKKTVELSEKEQLAMRVLDFLKPKEAEIITDFINEIKQTHINSRGKLEDTFSKVSNSDALYIGKIILGWSNSDEAIAYQVKEELLSSPNFWNAQTNLSGSDWLKIFQYLQMNGYEINALY